MKKKLTIALLALGAMLMHNEAVADNVLAIENLRIAPGGEATLPILMNNTTDVTAFSFELTLPEGISVKTNAKDKPACELTDRADDQTMSSNLVEGVYYFACLSLSSSPFFDNSGAICNIPLVASESVAEGDYTINVRNIELASPDNIKQNPADVSCTLTVGEVVATYDEGYSVRVLPFLLSDEIEVSFLVSNETDLTNVDFDVVLPQTLVDNELYYTDVVLAKTKFTTTLSQNDDGTEHVSIARRSSNKIAADDNFAVATLGVVYDEAVADGVYPILIKNVTLTDVNGDEFSAAPFTAYMIVDQYERETATEWGTICLPYATQSDENVQIYALTEVNPGMSEMTFAPVANLAANTPAVFKRLGAKAVFPVAAAAEAEDFSCEVSTSVSGWNMVGTYADIKHNSSDTKDVYYVAEDKFWYANMEFAVAAFRGWFETAKNAAGAQRYSIVETEGLTNGVEYVELEDGSVKVIFDLQGRRMDDSQKGNVNIVNGKTVIVK